MQISLYPSSLPKELVGSVQSLLDRNFGVQSEEDKITHYAEPVEWVICFEDGQPVGLVKLFLRDCELRDQQILIGGIGGVCVDEEFRGQGIAKLMMEKAKEELGKMKCGVAMLCTDLSDKKFVELYSNFGFIRLEKDHLYQDKNGHTRSCSDAMVAPINSAEKIDLIKNSPEPINIGQGEF